MEVGKIEFNANPESATPKGWPQPKTKEELEEERTIPVWERTNKMAESLIPQDWEKVMKKKEDASSDSTDVMDKQVGGSHYKQYKIQPYEFFIMNQIPHHKAAIIRRILRYDHPTGKGLEDLKKISHEIEMIIQLENWESTEESKIGTPVKEKACKCE